MRSSGKGRSLAKRSASSTQSMVRGGTGPTTQTSDPPPALGAQAERVSLYDEVTGRIIAELAAGRAPWVRPWGKASGAAPGLPRNALTGRSYSGVNVLLLWGALIEHGFDDQGWLTFRQAQKAGGQVRRGERGTTVVYADRFTPKDEAARAAQAGEAPGVVPFLKRFTVFNIAQASSIAYENILM